MVLVVVVVCPTVGSAVVGSAVPDVLRAPVDTVVNCVPDVENAVDVSSSFGWEVVVASSSENTASSTIFLPELDPFAS